MNTGIIIAILLVAAVVGFVLGMLLVGGTIKVSKIISTVVSDEMVDSMLHNVDSTFHAERKQLQEQIKTLEKKILFYKDWLCRGYIEQYYDRNIEVGDYQVYTIDALVSLRNDARKALANFQSTWNSKNCNEQCEWVKKDLTELIERIDFLLNDSWGNEVLDLENEAAFQRFFPAINTNMSVDRSYKDNGTETKELTYWHPQGGWSES